MTGLQKALEKCAGMHKGGGKTAEKNRKEQLIGLLLIKTVEKNY